MNDQRPTRWPCSADSSRNAGPSPRSFRKAETGVSQSSMKLSWTGTTFGSATAANEHLLGGGQAEPAAAQQHRQVVEDVGRLLGHALVRLLAGRPGDLLGLLLDLVSDPARVGQQLRGVRAGGTLLGPLLQRALQSGERLVRRRRLELAVVEASALAGVAGRAGGLDEGEDRVAVAVQPQRLDRLRVAGRGALVPELVARAAPQVQLAGLP